MAIVIRAPRILVKASVSLTDAPLRLDAGSGGPVRFRVEPLFRSVGRTGRPHAPAAAPAGGWYVLTPESQPAAAALDGVHAWDLCHRSLRGGLGMAGVPAPQFAEPDFQQQWITGEDAEQALALAAPCTAPEPQDSRFPVDPNPLWFHDPAHAQFDAALAALGAGGAQRDGQARIAHLDTGYDPEHQTLPAGLETSLQWNFVDPDRPRDASDDSGGPFNNLGHGTGTLSVLAGKAVPGLLGGRAMGAAPFARIVPIRVANRVVLLETSAIARAFDYVHGLCANPQTRVDVVTMSMGGLASQAWAEAVNALYDAGVFVVTAAGNNFGNLPTRQIVFPARFNRVVAACGVMANHRPYADLPMREMAGNYGPPGKMRTAMAGFTPNVPWAMFGCPDQVRLSGAGTSCATPQVAAAAAIWITQHRAAWEAYPSGWMRVEAVRQALFATAHDSAAGTADHLGHGELRVADALARAPAAAGTLRAEAPDAASFPLIRVLLGLGVAAPDASQRMLELEALQLSQSAAIERLVPDPSVAPETLPAAQRLGLAEALIAHPRASETLRNALKEAAGRRSHPVVPLPDRLSAVERLHLQHATQPEVPSPARRPLRVYAYDPSLGTHLETLGINDAVLDVPWEEALEPGPVGRYVEVVDVDPTSRCCYAPVDLNAPSLLVQSGLAPSESSPQFHQQMVYAVAMKTIEHFERGLGRVALWSPRLLPTPPALSTDGTARSAGRRTQAPRTAFVERLRIYPHALREANSFYSPTRKALLLGYFSASPTDSGDVLPGGLVFGALSHDIIAHETTHALLDGLHQRFSEPTNPDVLAFHEAFADIVALFQHFTLPAALRQQIANTRGDLTQESLLAQLAVQFGHATGRYGALRDAIGTIDDGHWRPRVPSRVDYQQATEPHDRGAILVAAVFAAFLQIYAARAAELLRLASGGTGILPAGALPAQLVDRLAEEASKVAAHVLTMCIRALDYCPPVDITFGDFLRAVITADRDLVPEDQRAYRVAFVSAFRDRGIYPDGVKSLSVDSLVWEPPPLPLRNMRAVLDAMSLDWDLAADRRRAYDQSRANAAKLHAWLMSTRQVSDDEIAALGLSRKSGRITIGSIDGELRPIEVHSVRPARRVGPDGQLLSDLVVEITQTFRPTGPVPGLFRGGCTLLVGLREREVRYFVRKRVDSGLRLEAQQAFGISLEDPLHAMYFGHAGVAQEPFAVLHRGW